MADPLEIVVELVSNLLFTTPLLFPVTPELWLCSESGSPSILDNAAVLFCSAEGYDRDCGVVAMAGLLLHELTHICFRNLFPFDQELSCDVAYITGNYFLFAARSRFPTIAVSFCCRNMLDPATDDMSDGWLVAPNGPTKCVGMPLLSDPVAHPDRSAPTAGAVEAS